MTTEEEQQPMVFNPDEYISKPENNPVQVTKVTKKRKTPYDRPAKKDTELSDLRKRAESMCKSWEQAKIVRRYKKQRIEDWIEQHEFDRDAMLRDTVFDFIHKGYAFGVDFLTKGDGFVRERLENDASLRTSIEDEGRGFVKFLSNKARILMLSAGDVYSGKMEQQALLKHKATVIEITDDETCYNETTVIPEQVDPSSSAPIEEEEVENVEAQVLPVSEGEENLQSQVEPQPCGDMV